MRERSNRSSSSGLRASNGSWSGATGISRAPACSDRRSKVDGRSQSPSIAAVADKYRAEPLPAKALEGLIQSKRDALDQDDDRRSTGGRGAPHLIFHECPSGERKQRRQAPGIVFLIGSDQSAERQAITLSVTPVASHRRA